MHIGTLEVRVVAPAAPGQAAPPHAGRPAAATCPTPPTPIGALAPVSVVASTKGSGAQGVATGAIGAAASAIGGGSAPAADQCIFAGYVLSQKLHLETGVTNSTITVWGQDVSWLMNLEEKSASGSM